MKVLGGYCCFAANSFYCLRLPIHPMLEGGDPNAMLGGHKSPWGLMLLRSKLFLLSIAPNLANAGGGQDIHFRCRYLRLAMWVKAYR